MGVDWRFVLAGAKRVVDSRPFYAQMMVTDDCNLRCSYCDEYAAGAPAPPLAELMARVDKLDALGVLVYDLLGGEPLLHPGIAALVGHVKSKRRGSNLCTIITNGFLLTRETIRGLNAAGLDFMQVSVDSIAPTPSSQKSLKSVLPKLKLLAEEAKFTVEIQTVLCEATLDSYDEFRRAFEGMPFAFGFSIQHGPGGRIAVKGERYLELMRRYGVFDGVNFYGPHLSEMLAGDFSRPWKCLAGFKFLYVAGDGCAQFCGQQRQWKRPLAGLEPPDLKENDRHKPCEPGCSLGCVRLISLALGEPVKSIGSSLGLLLSPTARKRR